MVGCVTWWSNVSTPLEWLLHPLVFKSLGLTVWEFFLFCHPLLLLSSHSVMSKSLQPHGLQHARLSCPPLSPGVCSGSCPLSRWCHQPSHPLLSPSPPTFNLSQHQGLFKWVSSSALSFLYGPTLTPIHNYWKNHSFDEMDLCWQSNVSAFEYAV